MKWTELNFWKSGECQVIRERLDDLRKSGVSISPIRKDIFRSLKETPYEETKVFLCGQDPYPNPEHATGLAFSVPPELPRDKWPPTLVNLLKEYQSDLHYPEPTNGSLQLWASRGVLLYNAIPSCTAYKSLSHSDWAEYSYLTKEIIEELSKKEDILFVFLGNKARENSKYVADQSKVLTFTHPSPRANLSAKIPFLGSRMFTTINSRLKSPIDWRLS